MKAVFLDFATMGSGLDVTGLNELFPGVEVFDVTANDDVAERIRGAAFVFCNKSRIRGDAIRGNDDLRYIGLTATGTDNIDIEAATECGVTVRNIRAYCTRSIAEHVFGCLLNLTRNLGQFDKAVRAGKWQSSPDFCLLSYPMHELSAMTLGIVGYGELGRGVARVAEAFGMRVIVSARPGSAAVPDGRVAFEELLEQSDVVSLHCPLNENNEKLFGESVFRKMKSNAILINTARGGLVDSAALVTALQDGEIAAAAIDVLPQEPPVDGNPLLDYDGANLMITPHVAWGSNEARQAAIDQLVENARAFLAGHGNPPS